MKHFSCCLLITLSLHISKAEDVRLDILPPQQAKQIIDSKDQTLNYAPKIDSNVPAVRVLGKTPTNVLEDVYLANQYHGQDGLGSYLYGYSVPDIAKSEKKQAGGDLKGSYKYVGEDGKELRVMYWDDGTGFHQVDNAAEIAPKQVDDAPDVKAAKEEFFRRWHEEAARNSQGTNQVPNIPGAPHPGQNYPYGAQGGGYSSNIAGQQQPGQGGQYQQPNLQSASGPAQLQPSGIQQPPSYGTQGAYGGTAGQTLRNYGGEQPLQHSASQQQSSYSAQTSPGTNPGQSQPSNGCCGQTSSSGSGDTGDQGNWKYEPTPEEQGPPHGFFYNVDYPVGIIVSKEGQHKRDTLQDIYVKNKERYEQEVLYGAGNASGYQAHG